MRNMFILKAYEMFPNLNGYITRAQVQQVCQKHDLTYPQWLTSNPEYRYGRGMYKMPNHISTDYVPSKPEKVESDEQIESRIADTYESMISLVKSVASNTVNSLVLSGAPGIGKSYTVEKTLQEVNGGKYGYVIHKGYIRATHLFRLLWENRHSGSVVVLDDTDAVFGDETALNMLKAALELKPVRRIGWGSEKEFIDQDGDTIPRYFDFEGSVIFLTNLDFHDMAGGTTKNAPHLAAIESRSLVLDLGIKTRREYLVKINQTVKEGMLRNRGLTHEQEAEVMDFIRENLDGFRELSLRMVEKVAALYKTNKEWKKLVRSVCMVKGV
jgi:hypothetical protein